MTGGASAKQKGKAAELRGQKKLSPADKEFCNQVVHSGDTVGQYATTPNPHRDPTNSYDPVVQQKLNEIAKK